jgi:hypothetical protein
VLHRFRPRAFGRAAAIRKRMSHIQVTLENRGGAEGKKPAKVSEPKPKAQKKPAAKKPAAKRTTKKTESKE